jgi:hypothetical protein
MGDGRHKVSTVDEGRHWQPSMEDSVLRPRTLKRLYSNSAASRSELPRLSASSQVHAIDRLPLPRQALRCASCAATMGDGRH